MSSRSSLRRKLLYSTGCLGAQTSVVLSFLFVFSSITILFLSKHKDFTVNAQIAYGHDLRSDIVDVGVEKREYWLMSTRSASSNPRTHCCSYDVPSQAKLVGGTGWWIGFGCSVRLVVVEGSRDGAPVFSSLLRNLCVTFNIISLLLLSNPHQRPPDLMTTLLLFLCE